MKRIAILLACVLAVFVMGCESDEASGGGSGVTGTWKGSGFYDGGVALNDFTMVLNQDGTTVSGSYDITRPNRHMVGSVSGSNNGGTLDLTLNPNGTVDGTVSGNTMTIVWWESGFGGDIEGQEAHLTLTRQ
ncbi:MAG: hypothetical protein KJ726_09460 [Verrucomicrobia bacterium]|nr:hypothetical protein [Verrucomicrobiota bacterium]MBU1910261.1 hypothetical protein [Verrucomicrobiota bacterium]